MSAPRLVIAGAPQTELFGQNFDSILALRRTEANEFYAKPAPKGLSEDAKNVQRQAFAGLLWSKQFYHLDVRTWLDGDPAGPPPPESRKKGRTSASVASLKRPGPGANGRAQKLWFRSSPN